MPLLAIEIEQEESRAPSPLKFLILVFLKILLKLILGAISIGRIVVPSLKNSYKPSGDLDKQ